MPKPSNVPHSKKRKNHQIRYRKSHSLIVGGEATLDSSQGTRDHLTAPSDTQMIFGDSFSWTAVTRGSDRRTAQTIDIVGSRRSRSLGEAFALILVIFRVLASRSKSVHPNPPPVQWRKKQWRRRRLAMRAPQPTTHTSTRKFAVCSPGVQNCR